MACRLIGAKPLSEPMLDVVYSNFRNKFQWNFKLNSYICVQENWFLNAVCEMAAILSWPQRIHDDIMKGKHFPRYLPFVRGIYGSPVNSLHKGQWRGALMFSLICAFNKLLSKQSWGWWFETPSRSLWRHCNVNPPSDGHVYVQDTIWAITAPAHIGAPS